MNKEYLCKYAISNGFLYEPDTGNVIGKSGKIIKRQSHGYVDIAIIVDGKTKHLPAHQFAFYCFYGYIPKIIDHINRDRLDNRISNLREVTKKQNNQNVLGKGYYLHSQTKKYCSQITVDYKHIHLGCYDTKEEASKAYLDAKKIYH